MRICLIRPPILVPVANPIVQFTPPIGLAYLAGTLRASGYSVQLIDALGAALDSRHPARNDCFLYGMTIEQVADSILPETPVIGISASFSFEWPTCRELVQKIRERFPDALLVGGGEHITALPEFSLNDSELDLAVIGEGEEILLEIVDQVASGRRDFSAIKGVAWKANGAIQVAERRPRIRNIDDIPLPEWDQVPITEYLDRGMGFGVNRGRSMPVLASRGCPFQCTFCSSPQMWTTRWIARDPDKLLDELASYQKRYGITNFDFYDLTAIVKKKWILDFCRKIEERGMSFTWQLPSGTRSEAIDAEVTGLLYRSGCRNLSYSPESGSVSVLARIKKKIELGAVLRSVQASCKSGINIKCNLIIGFPGETLAEVMESFGFICRMARAGCHDLSIWVFSPYPGSELFSELVAEGRIALSERYFDDLRSYADATRTVSYTPTLSSGALKVLRRAGTMLFYLVSWAVRPWRPFVMLLNVLSGRQESRSELAIASMLRRLRMRA